MIQQKFLNVKIFKFFTTHFEDIIIIFKIDAKTCFFRTLFSKVSKITSIKSLTRNISYSYITSKVE